MTNEEAIKILTSKLDGSVDTSWDWTEAVRIAIQALKDKRAYCMMAGRSCFAHGTQIAWCLTCPHISEEDRRLVVKAVEGIGKEDEYDE